MRSWALFTSLALTFTAAPLALADDYGAGQDGTQQEQQQGSQNGAENGAQNGESQVEAQLKSLTPSARKKILEHAEGGKIEQIEQTEIDGRQVYQIQVKRDDFTVSVDRAGKIVEKEMQNGELFTGAEPKNVQLSSLPQKVQTELRQHTEGGKVAKVQEYKVDGQTFYEATVTRKDKENLMLRLDGQGTLLEKKMTEMPAQDGQPQQQDGQPQDGQQPQGDQ